MGVIVYYTGSKVSAYYFLGNLHRKDTPFTRSVTDIRAYGYIRPRTRTEFHNHGPLAGREPRESLCTRGVSADTVPDLSTRGDTVLT